jgi:hypothetical protein
VLLHEISTAIVDPVIANLVYDNISSLEITFNADLSAPQKTALDTLVSVHGGSGKTYETVTIIAHSAVATAFPYLGSDDILLDFTIPIADLSCDHSKLRFLISGIYRTTAGGSGYIQAREDSIPLFATNYALSDTAGLGTSFKAITDVCFTPRENNYTIILFVNSGTITLKSISFILACEFDI